MKIELIGIYNGKPYHAFGFDKVREFINKSKGKMELVDSKIIEEHSKLIELIKNRK